MPCFELAHHLTLNFDLQNFGPVTLAIAIGAAQIHVTQELHFDMFKTRAAARGTPSVATVKAELGGGVAALFRKRRQCKNFSKAVPCAHITYRVGARRFANGRLVDKHHIA